MMGSKYVWFMRIVSILLIELFWSLILLQKTGLKGPPDLLSSTISIRLNTLAKQKPYKFDSTIPHALVHLNTIKIRPN